MADKPSRSLVLFGDGLARFIDSSHSHFHSLASLSSCGFLSLPNSPPSGSLLLNPHPLCVCNNAQHTLLNYYFSYLCPCHIQIHLNMQFPESEDERTVREFAVLLDACPIYLNMVRPIQSSFDFFFCYLIIGVFFLFLVKRGKSVIVTTKRIHQNKPCLIGILFYLFVFHFPVCCLQRLN